MNRSIIFLAALSIAAPTLAQRGGGFGRGSSGDVWKFLAEKYDANDDGKITPKEYGRGAEKFGGYDQNQDGSITKDDFSGGSRRRPGGRAAGPGGRSRGGRTGGSTVSTDIALVLAKNSDTNEDGKVTSEEWRKTLATLDNDQDSVVSPEELSGIMCAALGGRTLSLRAVGRRARHLDTNKDGKLQVAELSSTFAKLDKNGDKVISKVELGTVRTVRSGPPRVGDMAPEFTLPLVKDRKTLVTLSSFRGKKPVALIFGSYT
jgi:Ca2+-binding EF-hand superfamily protein